MKLISNLGMWAVLALCSSGCASGVEGLEEGSLGDAQQPIIEAGCTELGSSISVNACLHNLNGPYVSLVANSSLTALTPEFYQSFKRYDVFIPGSGSNRQGSVIFEPLISDDWAFFQDGTVPMKVTRVSTGATLNPLATPTVPGCPSIDSAKVYRFTKNVQYRIVFGPTSVANIGLVPLITASYPTQYWPDGDGDGYGDDSVSDTAMVCKQDDWVTNDDDCNDSNASLHPGVSDPAGGTDLNCDGTP